MYQHRERTPGMARLWDEVVEPAVNKRNIKVLYETAGKRLLRDPKCQIIGITATQGEREIRVKAKRAVILTCGGFENNPVLVRNYLCMIFPTATPWGRLTTLVMVF
jgi:hypothetical protein